MSRSLDQALTFVAQDEFPTASVLVESRASAGQVWILEVQGECTLELGRSRAAATARLLDMRHAIRAHRAASPSPREL